MNDLLESELQAAFASRLDAVSPEREARLLALDYRTKVIRRRRLWAALGASGSALTGVGVAVFVLLASGTSVAYAGWTPVPAVPTPAALAAATAACNALHDAGEQPVLTGTPVLTDARGKYTAGIYVADHVARVCISDGQGTETSLVTDGATLELYAAPGPGQLSDPVGTGSSAAGFSSSPSSIGSGQEVNATGLAGSDVSAVAFVFSDERMVDATVQNGWYFAWWPGRNWPSSVEVTTSTGTVTSPMAEGACEEDPDTCVFAGEASGGAGSNTVPSTQTAPTPTTTGTTTTGVSAVTSMHAQGYVAETAGPNGEITMILTNGHTVSLPAAVVAAISTDRTQEGLPPIRTVSATQAEALEKRGAGQ